MEKRELTCIGCPLGCAITVTLEGGEVKDVAGFTCKRGKEYACKEVTNPTRIVTSTVRLTGSKTGAAEQKMFLDFLKKGLAYRKDSWVNWDPVEMTVLANERRHHVFLDPISRTTLVELDQELFGGRLRTYR